jgi:four helix bundle protein
MRDFRQIRVWVKAHQLTIEIYRITVRFPREEQYGLTSQLRRASVSIAANIAEGYGRGGNTELARFLQMSVESAYEVEYHALLARDLQFLDLAQYETLQNQIIEVKRMLAALLVKVKADSRSRVS